MRNISNGLYRLLSWAMMEITVIVFLLLINALEYALVGISLEFFNSQFFLIILFIFVCLFTFFLVFKYCASCAMSVSEHICKSEKGLRYLVYSIFLIISAIINLAFSLSPAKSIGSNIAVIISFVYFNTISVSLLLRYKKIYVSPKKDELSPSVSAVESEPNPATPFEQVENFEQLELNMDSITPPEPEEPKKKFGVSKIVIALLIVSNIVTAALAINNYNANKISVEKYVAERETHNNIDKNGVLIRNKEDETREYTETVRQINEEEQADNLYREQPKNSNDSLNGVERLSMLVNMAEIETLKEASFYRNYACVVSSATGRKYHRYSCYFVQGLDSIYIFNIEYAKAKGYEPCKVCFSQNSKKLANSIAFSEWVKKNKPEDK